MKVKNLSIFLASIFVPAIMILSGCALNHVDLVEKGTVFIERVPSRGVAFSSVHVKQASSELVITGKVKRRSISPINSGHVDIAIIGPEGKLLEKISTFHIPRILSAKRGRYRGSRFEVRLTTVLSEGSKVRLAYHRTTQSVSRTFNCGDNAALPDT